MRENKEETTIDIRQSVCVSLDTYASDRRFARERWQRGMIRDAALCVREGEVASADVTKNRYTVHGCVIMSSSWENREQHEEKKKTREGQEPTTLFK